MKPRPLIVCWCMLVVAAHAIGQPDATLGSRVGTAPAHPAAIAADAAPFGGRSAASVRSLTPRRVARLNERMELQGEWMEPTALRGACATLPAPVFDTMEYEYDAGAMSIHDVTMVGGDACFSGGDAGGTRWVAGEGFGPANRPRHVVPFILSAVPPVEEVRVVRVGVSIDEDPGVRYILVQIWDNHDGACAGSVASVFVDFLLFDLGEIIPADPSVYFLLSVDLCELGTFLRMPADGEGAIDLSIASAVDFEQGTVEYPGRSSFGLWSSSPGGVGVVPSIFNWVVSLDSGQFFQCVDYSLVSTCPGPVTAMVAFEADFDACGGGLPGDADCDASVSEGDLTAFAMAVADPPLYGSMNPSCSRLCTCDLDGDLAVTGFDIDPFVDLLPPGPAPVAQGQRGGHYIRLFLSTTGVEEPETDPQENSPITGSPAQSNPTLNASGGRVFVWAQLSSDDQVINGISFSLRATGSVHFKNFHVINNTNVDNFEGARWDFISPGMIVGPANQSVEGACVVAVHSFGVASHEDGYDEPQFDDATKSVPIAFFDAEGVGDIFIEVGAQGISRRDGPGIPGELLFLGFGDEGDDLRGASYGQVSSLRDARFRCTGDLNGDSIVNTGDLGLLLGSFGFFGGVADINGDGIVNTPDLGLLIGNFGADCP